MCASELFFNPINLKYNCLISDSAAFIIGHTITETATDKCSGN